MKQTFEVLSIICCGWTAGGMEPGERLESAPDLYESN